MKTLGILTTGSSDFFVGEYELASPGPGEVLVEIKASGVCHTDWDVKRSAKDVLVMGHEGAGVVREVGAGVTACKPGDHVALNWAIPCGKCFQCVRGAQNICESKPQVVTGASVYNGNRMRRAFALGTMAQHTVVREEACIVIDSSIPFSSACIVGCGVMTGVGSVINAAKLQPGTSAVILGCGGVGLNCIQGAVVAGASMIIGVDVNDSRLELAKKFGATHLVKADRADVGLLAAAKQVRELTGGRGADYSFECTAVPELGTAPLAMVRNGGTAIQASGIEQPISFDMELFEWDKIYLNPLYGQCVPSRDFPRLFGLYRKGLLKLDELVTRTYTINDLAKAFDDMHAGVNAKGVILF